MNINETLKTKTAGNWAGLVAIVWMMSAFLLIHYVVVPRQIVIGPFWLWIFATLAVQLVPGLVFAIAGLRCGNRAGRVAATLAIGLFLWFVWYGLIPVLAMIWQLAK